MADIVTGIVRKHGKAVLLYDPLSPFEPEDSILVPTVLAKECGLVDGAEVTGPVRRHGGMPELAAAQFVCGLTPDSFKKRTPYKQLEHVPASGRYLLDLSDEPGMRVIDLVAPLGRGGQCLIVSPPRTGRLILFEQIARAIRKEEPETQIVALLMDEKPTEASFLRRTAKARIFACYADQPAEEHLTIIDLALSYTRLALECGRDIVLMADSLNQMAHVSQVHESRQHHSDFRNGSPALEIPECFFGVARNLESRGSITVITALSLNSDSSEDRSLYEAFHDSGHSLIVLGGGPSPIYPAIDLSKTESRRDERFYTPDEYAAVLKLRKAISFRPPDAALERLLDLFKRYPTNARLLKYGVMGSSEKR
jgi:transcription termination factor Rho